MRRADRPLDTMTETARPLLTQLMGQRFISFYPVLAHLTWSVKCALLLGHALSWTRHYARHEPQRDGWFWQTKEQWEDATGLSRHEQLHARQSLRDLGILIEEGRGMPRRTWFRIDLDKLATVLGTHIGRDVHQWSWSESAVRTLLGRPVPIHHPLVCASGSVTSGIYLGWMCTRVREARNLASNRRLRRLNAAPTDTDEKVNNAVWLDVSMTDSQANLAMGRRQMEGARKRLIDAGLITECWGAGVPARKLTGLNIDSLMAALSVGGAKAKFVPNRAQNKPDNQCLKGMAESYIPACTKADDWNGGIVHSSMDESGQQGCTKPADMMSGFVHPLYGVKTSTQLHPPNTEVDHTSVPHQRPGSSFSASIQIEPIRLDAGLSPDEQKPVRQMLAKIADQTIAQQVADEWTAQCARGAVRSPLSYLSALIAQASKGQFVPALAPGLAQARRNADALEAARRQPPPGMQRTATTLPTQAKSGAAPRSRPSDETMKTLQELRRKMRCVTVI